MEKIAHFKSQFMNYDISAIVYSKNNGLIIDIIAPNDHLGGIGVGVPYKNKNGKKTANSHAISIPKHRDAELASRLAQILAKQTQMNVVVILGIHIPDMTDSLLRDLDQFFKNWFTELALKLSKISS